MLWKLRHLEKFALRARDGVIGRVDELFVDDGNWLVRYLVVETGDWLSKRRVLVSPLALEVPNAPAHVIPVDLTRAQVEKAPPVDTKKPVSRHFEMRYHDYYGWPYYWVGGPMWGPFLTPGELARAQIHRAPAAPDPEPEHPHLRSTRELRGYRFEARDGKIGHIGDFVVDDRIWMVKYLEIDTRKWLPGGRKVLLAREWIREVSWHEKKIVAEVTRRAVEQAPDYDDAHPIPPEYEQELLKHYGLKLTAVGFR